MSYYMLAIPLIMSILGVLLLWHTRRDTWWCDLWALMALSPLFFVVIVAALR